MTRPQKARHLPTILILFLLTSPLLTILALNPIIPTAEAASSVVQWNGTSCISCNSLTLTLASAVTAGDLIAAAISVSAAQVSFSVSDSFLNTYTIIQSESNTAGASVAYTATASTGTLTVTASWPTSTAASISVAEVSGMGLPTYGSQVGTTCSSIVSLTYTNNNQFLIAAYGTTSAATVITAGAYFTLLGTSPAGAAEYSVSKPSPSTFPITLAIGGTCAGVGVAFSSGPGGQNTGASATTCTSISVAFTNPISSGNLIVVTLSSSAGGTPAVPTDTLNTQFVQAVTASGTSAAWLYYGYPIASGADTVTSGTVTSGTCVINVYELSGYTTTGAVFRSATGTTSVASVASTAFNTGSILIAAVGDTSGTPTAGTGFTLDTTVALGGAEHATSGITSPTTWPFTTPLTNWSEVAAAFPSLVKNTLTLSASSGSNTISGTNWFPIIYSAGGTKVMSTVFGANTGSTGTASVQSVIYGSQGSFLVASVVGGTPTAGAGFTLDTVSSSVGGGEHAISLASPSTLPFGGTLTTWAEVGGVFQMLSPSLIQSTGTSGTTSTCAPSFTNSMTAGDLIILTLGTGTSLRPYGLPSDTLGDTFIMLHQTTNSPNAAAIWYSVARGSGADTPSISWTGGTTPAVCNIYDVRGTLVSAIATGSSAIVYSDPDATTLIQYTGGSCISCTSESVAYATNPTKGNFLFAAISTATAPSYSISDTLGNSWVAAASSSNTAECAVYYAVETAASGADTVSASWAGGTTAVLNILEVSGLTAANLKSISGTGTGTSAATSSLSFFASNPLLLGCVGITAGTSLTAGLNFKLGTTVNAGGGAEFNSTGSITSPTTFPMTWTTSGTWADAGVMFLPQSYIGVQGPSSLSTASERWCTAIVSTTCQSAFFSAGTGTTRTQTFYYYDLLISTSSYALNSGSGATTAPILSYTGGPTSPTTTDSQQALTLTLATTVQSIYAARGSTASVTSTITGGGYTWTTPVISWTMNAAYTIPAIIIYYLSAGLTLSYAVIGGGSPTAPTLTYTKGGTVTTTPLTTTPTAYTADAGTPWNVTPNPLTGSTSTERWGTNQVTSYQLAAVVTIVFNYYHQYSTGTNYTIVGGGSFKAPTFTYVQYGSGATLLLTLAKQNVWVDSGSAWSVTNPLVNSTSLDRAYDNKAVSGTLSSVTAFTFKYWHQYDMTVNYVVSPAGTLYSGNPTLKIVQFGLTQTITLTTATHQYWMDVFTLMTPQNPFVSGASTFIPAPTQWQTNTPLNPITFTYAVTSRCAGTNPTTLIELGCLVPAVFYVYFNLIGQWFAGIFIGTMVMGVYLKTENGVLSIFLFLMAAMVLGALFPPIFATAIIVALALIVVTLVYEALRSQT